MGRSRGDGRHLYGSRAALDRPRRAAEQRPAHPDERHRCKPRGLDQRHGRPLVSAGDRARRRQPVGHPPGAVPGRLRDAPGRRPRHRPGHDAAVPVPAVHRRLQRPAHPREPVPRYILREQHARFRQLSARRGVSATSGLPHSSATRRLGCPGGGLDRSVLLQRPGPAMTTDGRSEGPMHIRSAMLLAVALSFPGAAVAQMNRAALVKQSDIIFIGTVTHVGAVAVPEVPPSDRTVVVLVDQVLEKPAPVALTAGDSVTVETARAGSLKAGIQATFYTTGWIFGRGVAVREVGHEPGQSPVVKAHIQRAAMVVAGRVEQVRPAELAAAPARPKRITEHDPDWQEAIIQVEDGIKGAKAGEQVVVRFPGSPDVAWVGTPKFAVGQEGTFLLHKDSTTGSPLTTIAGRSVPAYTALHKVDVLSKQDATRVRALIRKP